MSADDALLRLAGALRLRGDAGSLFGGADGPSGGHDVTEPRVVVGRHDGDADVLVIDHDGFVSRSHVMLDATGGRWTITDLESAHGTALLVGGHLVHLAPGVPYPVKSSIVVILARTVRFRPEVTPPQQRGRITRGKPPVADPYIADPVLAKLADALLAPRRNGSSAVPPVTELADTLGYSSSTVYDHANRLATLDPVSRLMASNPARKPRRLASVADAVGRAYPYLLRPR